MEKHTQSDCRHHCHILSGHRDRYTKITRDANRSAEHSVYDLRRMAIATLNLFKNFSFILSSISL